MTAAAIFNDAIFAAKPVLVVFTAAWCAPCRKLKDELARAVGNRRLRVVEIELDEAQDLALARGVRAVPTLLLFRAGEELDRRFGAPSAATLGAWLDETLKKKGKA